MTDTFSFLPFFLSFFLASFLSFQHSLVPSFFSFLTFFLSLLLPRFLPILPAFLASSLFSFLPSLLPRPQPVFLFTFFSLIFCVPVHLPRHQVTDTLIRPLYSSAPKYLHSCLHQSLHCLSALIRGNISSSFLISPEPVSLHSSCALPLDAQRLN